MSKKKKAQEEGGAVAVMQKIEPEEAEGAPESDYEGLSLALRELTSRDSELTDAWNKAQDKKLKAVEDMEILSITRRANSAAISFVEGMLAKFPPEAGLPLWKGTDKELAPAEPEATPLPQ